MTSYDNSSESKFPSVLGYLSGGGEGGVTVKWSSRSFSGISHLGEFLSEQMLLKHCFLLALYHFWILLASDSGCFSCEAVEWVMAPIPGMTGFLEHVERGGGACGLRPDVGGLLLCLFFQFVVG